VKVLGQVTIDDQRRFVVQVKLKVFDPSVLPPIFMPSSEKVLEAVPLPSTTTTVLNV